MLLLEMSTRATIGVAVIGLIGTCIIAPLVIRGLARVRRANLKLDDITIDEEPAQMVSRLTGKVQFRFKLPVLHIFAHNAGEQVAVVTRLSFHVRQKWHLHLQQPLQQIVTSSASYNLEMDPRRDAPYTLETNISHSLAADASDRFDLTIGVNPMTPFESFYLVTLTLTYGDNQTNSLDCLLVLPALLDSEPQYLIGGFYKHYEYLEQTLKEAPTSLADLRPHQRVHWEMRLKHLAEDLSPEGKEKAFADAKAIDRFNRDTFKAAADQCDRRSPRAAELIGRLPETEVSSS